MSDRVAKSYHNYEGKDAQSIHPYQSAWMGHWMGTSSERSPHMHNHLSCPPGNMGDDHDIKQHHFLSGVGITSDISRSARRSREVEIRTSEIINESVAVGSKNSRNVGRSSQSLPIFKLCQESGRSYISKNDRYTSGVEAVRPQVACKKLPATLNIDSGAPPATETSSREFHFQPEGVLQIPAEQVKYHMFFGESNYSCSRPSKETITSSASHIRLDHGEYKFDSGTTAVPSFMRRQETNQLTPIFASKEHMSKTNLTILGQEHCNYHSNAAVLVCEGKMNNFPKCENSVTPYLKQNYTALLKNDPSTSSKHSPEFGEEQYQRMQNPFGIGFFPSWSSPPEMTKLGKLHYGQCSLQSIPPFVQDMETTKICTSPDSAEVLAGGLPRFSQTTHSLLITKHADVNLCKENQILRESRVSTQLKESTFGELHSTSPFFGHGQRGVKLRLLGSSSDSEEKENVEDVKTSGVVQKNESSAETDTMDMESFKEKNHLSGANSSQSNKDIMVEVNFAPQGTTALATEEVRQRECTTELPDINIELPALPAASSSMERAEPCTSRTQSLDMETLLFHADQPSNSKSNEYPEDLMGPDPGKRWIKRLKLSASSSLALGTKSTNLSEALSHEKVSKIFSKIMEGTTRSSKPTLDKRHGKEIAQDRTTAVLRKGESSFVETRKESHDKTLSHAWIRRWCRNQAQKKPETVINCELRSSKLALEDLQKKQFPSIAAMALMGKAMTGFRQCEFQKRDSFVVWNTKGF